ncbi:MAG TPA: HIRAN domain-containing protein [Bacteroidales bacterium]|nr:HIRAN domain-containing protein [Bacteroidales bacterium]HRZ20506.1 HIRAN domain-containing protein [Bacteroidales bacterium]
MNRKSFLTSLLMGTTATFLPAHQVITESHEKQKVRLGVSFIAGFQYYDGPDAELLLETDMPLQLNREPHNRYDKNAVEVWSGDAKLGYVPRAENKPIARLMDEGRNVQARILQLDPASFPYGSVKMELFFMSNAA